MIVCDDDGLEQVGISLREIQNSFELRIGTPSFFQNLGVLVDFSQEFEPDIFAQQDSL